MGRKIRAAKASLVAAFLAAGGVTATTANAKTAGQGSPPSSVQINWGDQFVRFLKLDGFPAYLKIDGFAQFYKERSTLLADATAFYYKHTDVVDAVLALYQKADAGPLAGILIGLEQYYKEDNIQPLLDYLRSSDAAYGNYFKFQTFLSYLKLDSPSLFDFFYKETGIAGNPLAQQIDTSFG